MLPSDGPAFAHKQGRQNSSSGLVLDSALHVLILTPTGTEGIASLDEEQCGF